MFVMLMDIFTVLKHDILIGEKTFLHIIMKIRLDLSPNYFKFRE